MVSHPAKYNDAFMPTFAKLAKGSKRILDPFAGTGKIFALQEMLPDAEIRAIEIEPEWAALDPRIEIGDALELPFPDNFFDAIITSPCYGNRMADTLLDGYKRITYTSCIGRKLHPHNAGSLQWGKKYRDFHWRAWEEAKRVLQNGGIFILNIKDHIRAGEQQMVTDWHIDALQALGFAVNNMLKIDTPSMGFGENREKRVPYEEIIKFTLHK